MEKQLTTEFYEIDVTQSDASEEILIYKEKEGKEVALNSLYSANLEAKKFLEKLHVSRKVYILIGIGNGTVMKEWLATHAEEFIYLYVIEPFEKVRMSSDVMQFLSQNDKVWFEYFEDIHATSSHFRAILERYIGVDLEIVLHPYYDKTQPQYLKDVIKYLKDTLNLIELNHNTERRFRKDWILEPLQNLRYTLGISSLDELKGKFVGQEAVLVASGPSLNDNIPLLHKMKQSTYIFAAGSAVNGLINKGIDPDFTTSFDSGDVNFESHFKDTKFTGPLIIGGSVNAKILHHHKGDAILVNIGIDELTRKAASKAPTFPSVPSVAIFTLQVIEYLGFSCVYFVGQDLALVNGNYYSEGVHHHRYSKEKLYTVDAYVESNSGENVGTTYQLKAFLETFVALLNTFDKTKIKVRNLSLHGAKIEGAPYLDPKQLVDFKPRKTVCYALKPKIITDEARKYILKTIQEFRELANLLSKEKRKLSYIKDRVVSLDDLKKTLRALKKVRKNDLFENVLTAQFAYSIQKMSNLFAYDLDKEQHFNEDRVLMVKEIKHLVHSIDEFTVELLNDHRLLELEKEMLAASL